MANKRQNSAYLFTSTDISQSPKSDLELLGAIAHHLILSYFKVGSTRMIDETSLIASQALNKRTGQWMLRCVIARGQILTASITSSASYDNA